MFTFRTVLDDNHTPFLKPVVCTGSSVVMGSWGLGKEQRNRFVGLFTSDWEKQSSPAAVGADAWSCADCFCGALGMAGGDWALSSCHPFPAQHLQGMKQWPFLPGTLIYVKWQRRKSPCLWTVELFWEFSQNPTGILLPLPKFSLCCVFISLSHYFLPVVLSSKKILHGSQRNCKTSRIYSFPSSIESKVRRCLHVSSFSF